MTAINPPQAVALRDIRTDDVVTIESGDDELGSTITGRVHGVDTCKTAILLGDQIWYSLADGSDWRYVSGYRRAPEVAPGTVGTATVRGVEGVRVVRTDRSPENDLTVVWFTPLEEQIGGWWHRESEVTSFVPDPDTAALRAEVEKWKDLFGASCWNHQAGPVRALIAEVDRLRERLDLPCPGTHCGEEAVCPAADEQAAEGEFGYTPVLSPAELARGKAFAASVGLEPVPAALPTRDEIAEVIRDVGGSAREFLLVYGVPEDRIIVSSNVRCVEPGDAANAVLALLKRGAS